jgi:hypothetical protein
VGERSTGDPSVRRHRRRATGRDGSTHASVRATMVKSGKSGILSVSVVCLQVRPTAIPFAISKSARKRGRFHKMRMLFVLCDAPMDAGFRLWRKLDGDQGAARRARGDHRGPCGRKAVVQRRPDTYPGCVCRQESSLPIEANEGSHRSATARCPTTAEHPSPHPAS